MKFNMKILSITVVVMLVVALLFVFLNTKKSESEPDSQVDSQTALFVSEADFNKIQLIDTAENTEIKYFKSEHGDWEIDQSEEALDQGKVDRTAASILSLNNQAESVDTPFKDTQLEESQRTIKLMDATGSEENLKIGRKSDDGTFYYIAMLNSKDVYKVEAQIIDALPVIEQDLINKSVVQVTAKDLNNITINNGTQIIELTTASPYSDEEVMTNLSGWFMHQPYNNVYSVKYDQMSDMIFGVESLEWEEIIDEKGGKLDEYGLKDVEFEITLGSESEESTILVGAPATNQTYYAKLKNEDRIFTINNEALHPYSYQAFDIVEKFVKITALDVLQELIIQGADQEIIITIDHEGDSESKMDFEIDGKKIDETVFRDLYKIIAGLSVSETVKDAIYDTPEAMMIYTISDSSAGEKEVKIEFVSYNDKSFAVFINGEADFLVKKEAFSKMINEINKVS